MDARSCQSSGAAILQGIAHVRRRGRPAVMALAVCAVGFGLPDTVRASPAAEPARPGLQASQGTAGTTPAGHAFLVPSDWLQTRRGSATILEAPERGSWIAFVDVQAQDADAAMAAGWEVYSAAARPELLFSAPIANGNGWRDGRNYVFRTPADSARSLTLRAMRREGRWAVRIDDLANAVAGRRAADLRLIRDAFLPAGYARESFAGRTAARLDTGRIAALTEFIMDSQARLGVPGVSIGVVQDGRTLFAGGFGVRELGRPSPVDADTLYLTASTTKQLTTLMLAKLVDEGRFNWDTPVIELLPQFRLADESLTPQVRVRHLVCACTGLPYRNLDWEFAPADSPATITLDILARMRSTSPFGTTYQYSNPIVASAGLVAGHVAYPDLELGRAYDAVMASRLFEPLGMTRTTFDFDRAMQGNYARSHGLSPSGELALVEPARDRQMHAVRPTGGAWSNVNDLLAYLKVELSGGLRSDGARYVSETALKARWGPQIATGEHSWYGMGLETDVSSGTPMLFHGGRLYGQRSNVVWFPEHGVGLVILMNASTGNVLMDAFPRKVLEVLFDAEPQADSMVEAAAATEREQRAAWRRTLNIPAAAAHTAMLAPRYHNELLGEIRTIPGAPHTVFDFGDWSAPAASREHPDGTVDFVLITPSQPAPFVVGMEGGRRTLTIRDAQNAYIFVEKR